MAKGDDKNFVALHSDVSTLQAYSVLDLIHT
jgi:hypothetical protein